MRARDSSVTGALTYFQIEHLLLCAARRRRIISLSVCGNLSEASSRIGFAATTAAATASAPETIHLFACGVRGEDRYK
jgi:hypothetical protein